jgi:DNA-binding IclR family transcriptional regulator
MLERLLQLVAEGGLHSYQDLGQRLSISPPLLDAMLEELVHHGYLRPVGGGCGGHCSGCAGGG